MLLIIFYLLDPQSLRCFTISVGSKPYHHFLGTIGNYKLSWIWIDRHIFLPQIFVLWKHWMRFGLGSCHVIVSDFWCRRMRQRINDDCRYLDYFYDSRVSFFASFCTNHRRILKEACGFHISYHQRYYLFVSPLGQNIFLQKRGNLRLSAFVQNIPIEFQLYVKKRTDLIFQILIKKNTWSLRI